MSQDPTTIPTTTLTIHNTPTNPSQPTPIELDSLPYIDNIHPDYEAYAVTLIEEEMQRLPPPSTDHSLDNRIDSDGIPLSFLSHHNQINEMEYRALLARRGAPRPNPIDYHQTYETTTTNNTPTTLSEYQTQLNQTKTKLQHELHRLLHTELQTHYEPNLWQHHVTTTLPSHYLRPLTKQLEEQRRTVDEINAERKRLQEEEGGERLRLLEKKWVVGLGRMEGLRRGIGEGRREVERLRALVGGDDSGGVMGGDGGGSL